MKIFEFLEDDIYSLHAREEVFLNDFDEDLISFSLLKKPSISIGAIQNYRDVTEEAIRKNIDVTRRQTGGRFMYLDQNDIIISFAASGRISSIDAYSIICRLITDSLYEVTDQTFSVAYVNDIIHSSGKKIGGASKRNSDKNSRYLVHAYIRYGLDPLELFRYCKIDEKSLEEYTNILTEHVTSISDLVLDTNFFRFYNEFQSVIIKKFEQYLGQKSEKEIFPETYLKRVDGRKEKYLDLSYIRGNPDYPSRGHCDAIAGSGNNNILKIPSLVGKVTYS